MARVNMGAALAGFQAAVQAGRVRPGLVSGGAPGAADLYLYQDAPQPSVPRLTYARMEGAAVVAVAVITISAPVEGERCFHLGFAVADHARGQALAKDLAAEALEDFLEKTRRDGIDSFWLEAVVDPEDPAAIAVARSVLEVAPTSETDSEGAPCLRFLKQVEQSSRLAFLDV